MSDLLAVRQKVIDGKNWRKNIDVTIDGDEYVLCIRQLVDSEFLSIYRNIDIDKLQDFVDESDGDEDDFERLQTLRAKDELDEDEQGELEQLEETVGDEQGKIIEVLGDKAFDALQEAGRKAIVPDGDDINQVMEMTPSQQKESFGESIRTPEHAKHVLEQEMETLLEESVELLAFNVGLQAFLETLDDEGN